MGGQARALRLAAVLSFSLWGEAAATRDEALAGAEADASVVDGAATASPVCQTQVICFVTANKEADHDKEYRELFEGCLRANEETKVVALALQDFAGGEVPDKVKGLEKLKGDRFKLRHQLMLTNDVGEGHLCYGKWSGGAMATAIVGAGIGAKIGFFAGKGIGAIPGAMIGALGGALLGHLASTSLGASCGGVALLLYSLEKVDVAFDVKQGGFIDDVVTSASDTEVTATTIKGTVAGVFTINGRRIVLASTHAAEGVRAKKEGSACPLPGGASEEDKANYEKLMEKERNRVRQFRKARDQIQKLRGDGVAGTGAIWGGDFNPRTADPKTGCPIWPKAGEDAKAALGRLEKGKDVLGEDPDKAGVTTFASELAGTGLVELVGSVGCPTYKKQEAASTEKPGFSCRDGGSEDMFYMPSHPPSWTDRLFYSADDQAGWLACEFTRRVTHKSDHDAVLVACAVRSPECPAVSRAL